MAELQNHKGDARNRGPRRRRASRLRAYRDCARRLTSTEDVVGLALNKRGIEEGVPSDLRLKTHVTRAGETASGVGLYSFRYLGEDREFLGVMAQELLADEHNRDAVEAGADGYFRVDYARLGLAHLVTEEMLAAGGRALRRAPALTH